MDNQNLHTMETIMNEKARDIAAHAQPALDPEGVALAEYKRESFDMPINVAKTDPLR